MMQLRVLRDASAVEKERVETRPALVSPLDTTVVALHVPGFSRRLDRASFALVPARVPYTVTPESQVAAVVILLVGAEAERAARREYEPDFVAKTFEEVVGTARVLPRTRWVDEIVQRYVFERVVCEKHDSAAARFLETEITKELYFLGKEHLSAHTRASVVHEDDDVVQRARAWLDARLFEPLHVADLARHCGCSESTLLRAFRRALGVAPTAYVRNRRLDESLLLLESGRYNVSEVATRVGYGSVSAFTVAFGRRFGSSPSEVRPRTGATLPPHGEPPAGARRRRKRN